MYASRTGAWISRTSLQRSVLVRRALNAGRRTYVSQSESLASEPAEPTEPVASTSASSTNTPGNPESLLPTPHIDYKSILNNPIYKARNAVNREFSIDNAIPQLHDLNERHQQARMRLSGLRKRRKQLMKLIQMGDDTVSHGEAKSNKAALKEADKEETETLSQIIELALKLPNDTHPDVPIGQEPAAVQLSIHGPPLIPAADERHHVALNKGLQFMDLQSGALAAGNSWVYLKNLGASLELALTNYAMSVAIKHGYTPMMVPDVIQEDIANRCGFKPRNKASNQNYYLQPKKPTDQTMVLAGTAEIPLAATFATKIHDLGKLPLKVVGLGRAFRAEAGARGADTRGIYRVHQFSKVELFVVTEGKVEVSNEMMEDMRKLQIEIFEGLGFPFKVLDMPTAELGASAYRKYDMDAWMPGRGGWGEISSLSNCTDYQSRRLHIRHQLRPSEIPDENAPKTAFAHTLNGTAAAIPRLIIALLENGAILKGKGQFVKAVGLELPSVLKTFWVGDDSKITWR